MADSTLFQTWASVDDDWRLVLWAMQRLELSGEFADLSCADQAAALALALHLKRVRQTAEIRHQS